MKPSRLYQRLTRARLFLPLAVLVGASPCTRGAESAHVTLTAASAALRACDPLFLKVTLENRGTEALALPRPLGDKFGTLRLEMRPLGAARFQPARTRGSGLKDGEFPPTVVPPGGRLASHAVLFRYRQSAVFAAPGTYELRAVVRLGETEAVSEPVLIEVRPIPEAEAQLIERAGPVLEDTLEAASVGQVTPAQWAEWESKLSDSALKRSLRWLRLAAALGAASDPAVREELRRQFNQHRRQADPVTAEWMDLVLARQLARLGRWTEVNALLANFKEPSYELTRLRNQAESR